MAGYTNNYQLHQWEAGDDFLREDFNEDFAKIDGAIAMCGNCRIIRGSYWGTGTFGEKNPTGLTFDKLPLLVFVSGQASQFTAVWKSDYAVIANQVGSTYVMNINWSENALCWYSYDANKQLNINNALYHYVALVSTEEV